ncbi:MAG: hypothetical protein ACLQUY_19545 [Ktedonobacterales bacterium]
MNHDAFDVYKVIIEDTNHLNLRRQATDSFYVALLTFVLTGDAYVAYNAKFDSWPPDTLTLGIAAVGLAILARWRQSSSDFSQILGYRYAFLRRLEERPELSNAGATVFSEEYAKIYKSQDVGKHTNTTKALQNVFIIVFLLIPLILIGLTAANLIPAARQDLLPGILPGVATPTAGTTQTQPAGKSNDEVALTATTAGSASDRTVTSLRCGNAVRWCHKMKANEWV